MWVLSFELRIENFKQKISTIKVERVKKLRSKTISVPRTVVFNTEIWYEIEFMCAVMGPHIYRTTWAFQINKKLEYKKDSRR